MTNLEARELARCGLQIGFFCTDVTSQMIAYFGQKSVEFGPLAFYDQFDPTVGQVANESGHHTASRERPRCVPEADTLHVAAVVDGFSFLGVGGTHGCDWLIVGLAGI